MDNGLVGEDLAEDVAGEVGWHCDGAGDCSIHCRVRGGSVYREDQMRLPGSICTVAAVVVVVDVRAGDGGYSFHHDIGNM